MSEDTPPVGAPRRRRRWLLYLAPPVLVALYAAAGFLLVPWLVERELPRFFDTRLSLDARVQAVTLNPFTLRAEIRGFAADDRQGGAVASFDALRVDLRWRSFIELAPVLEDVRLEAPFLRIHVDPDGRINLVELAARLAGPGPAPGPSGSGARIALEKLVIAGGRIEIDDARAGFRESFADLGLEASALTTLEHREGRYRLAGRTASGAAIEWNGRISALPTSIEGTLSVKDLPLEGFSPYAAIGGLRFDGGLATLTLPYRASVDAGSARAGIVKATLALTGLSLASLTNAHPALRAESIVLEDIDADSATRKLAVGALRLSGLAAGGAATFPRASLAELAVEGFAGDLATQVWTLSALQAKSLDMRAREGVPPVFQVPEAAGKGLRVSRADRDGALESLRLSGAKFALRRAAAGRIDIGDWPGTGAIAAAPAGAAQGGWTFVAKALELAGVSGRYEDRTAKRPLEVRVDALQSTIAVRVAPGPGGAMVSADLGATRIGALAAGAAGASGPALRADGLSLDKAVFDAAANTASLGALRLERLSGRLAMERGRLTLLDLLPNTGPPSPAPMAVKIASAGIAAAELAYTDRAGGAEARIVGGTVSATEIALKGTQADLARFAVNAKEASWVDRKTPRTARVGGLAVQGGGVALGKGMLRLATAKLGAATLSIAEGRAGKPAGASTGGDGFELAASKLALSAGTLSVKGAAVRAGRAEASMAGLSGALRDPGLSLGLVAPRLKLTDVATQGKAPTAFELATGLKAGGRIALRGKGVLADRTLEARIEASELALSQIEPLLRRHANIRFGSGLAALSGNIAAGGAGDARFDGGALISNLSLLDADGAPVIGWKALDAPAIRVSLDPLQVRIEELRLDGPQARVGIGADRSFNLGKLLIAGDPAPAKPAAAPASSPAAPPLALEVRRIRVTDGKMDFSDDSLSPGFRTSIHGLAGTASGLSSDPGTRGRFALQGAVDETGHVDLSGTVNPFAPREGTRVRMRFRGLDLTRVTPYAMKFAGYRIDEGTASLDLQYRVDGGMITGENQIVLSALKLGDKVASEDAADLPIELAIALLKGPDGRIDVGLSVSGNFDDPQFDYGAIVSKAIGNFFGSLFTAPFRALAGMLGGETDDIGTVRFDAGSARLLPHERARLGRVAQALGQRPELKVRVPAQYDAQADAKAHRQRLLRREIARRAGFAAEGDADPGPISVDDRPTRQALESLFTERFGKAAFAQLGARAANAAADARQRAVFDAVLERLRDSQPVPAGALEAIAQGRADAIGAVLREAGVGAGRIELGKVETVSAAEATQVTIELGLSAK